MTAKRLLLLFERAGKRAVRLGDSAAGAIVGLDLEGRWYGVLGGEIVSRVSPEAVVGQSARDRYLNPGGDGLWPAPEGTAVGYQYAAGAWRVPPGLVAARFRVTRASARGVSVCAEVDLVNNRGVGMPARFERRIAVAPGKNALTVKVVESLTYLGRRELRNAEALLAPWSLGQFDCGPGCEVVFPCRNRSAIWDLYGDPSDGQRTWESGLCRTRTDGSQRYQIGIGPEVPWIEYRDPRRGLTVRRTAGPLPAGEHYIDIRDAAPEARPSRCGVRYSVYSDRSGFMEIEAAGGCPEVLRPGGTVSVTVNTRFAVASGK